jgi:hypothetical protein
MIDALPVGYLALEQAMMQVAASISEQVVLQEAQIHRQAYLACFDSEWRNGKNAAKNAKDKPWLHYSEMEWFKRESAILTLKKALSNGDLIALVRDPVRGVIFQLTAVDWCRTGFWRDTIIGGVVRASVGEEIARHNDQRVFFEAAAFEDWLKDLLQRKRHTSAAGGCQAWLIAEMRANLKRTQPKEHWREQARVKFGISGRAFDRIWAAALKEVPDTQWGRAGEPATRPR